MARKITKRIKCAKVRSEVKSRYEGLKAAKNLLSILKKFMDAGCVKWEQLPSITFGKNEVDFTPQEYFEYANDALDEAIKAARDRAHREGKSKS